MYWGLTHFVIVLLCYIIYSWPICKPCDIAQRYKNSYDKYELPYNANYTICLIVVIILSVTICENVKGDIGAW